MNNNNKALFITVEGIEGVGKSTCVQFLKTELAKITESVYVTREPGGTEVAEAIRKILLSDFAEPIAEDAELLLMFASRVQHVRQCILPLLNKGTWVLSDRYVDASYAYQGAGRGIAIHKIEAMENLFLHDIKPDLTIILTAPVIIAMERANNRGHLDRFERQQRDFFERAQAMYLQRAKAQPERYRIVDASLPLSKVRQQLTEIVQQLKA